MTLATKLFGIVAVCALCCTLPLTAVLTAGVFELGAVAWGISGGIASIVVAAILAIIVSRKSKSTDSVRQCYPVESNDASPAIACILSSGDYRARTKSIRELVLTHCYPHDEHRSHCILSMTEMRYRPYRNWCAMNSSAAPFSISKCRTNQTACICP